MLASEATRALQSIDSDSIGPLIRRFWAERLANAPEAIRRHCAPDIVFRIVGGAGAAGEAVYVGHDAAIEAVRTIDTNLEFLSFGILDMIVDGAKAALLWRAELAHRGTGVSADLSVFDLITVENGRITSYVEFLDTDGLQKVMRGEPQAGLARRANRELAGAPGNAPEAAPASIAADPAARDSAEYMLRAFWNRRVAAGSAAIAEYCTDDAELHLVGDPTAVPFARHHVGMAEVRALVDRIDMEFAYVRFAVAEVLVGEDRAALHWMADVRHRGTGAQGRVQALDHITLVDGRIRVITEFFDTAATATWIEG
jgi:ketosteroid isomerase-like protein